MNAPSHWWNAALFGGLSVTPARIALGIAVFLLSLLLSRWLRGFLARRASVGKLDPGARYSIERLLHYGLVICSLLVGLAVVGLDLRSLAVVAGALGIGVGLGLQAVTSNLVSGLILLFERPIRPGDRVSLGTSEQEATGQVNGYVRAIRLRSTTIMTPDNIMLIVPNAELVGRTIVNWSHGDPKMRIRLSVGVAYGSDLDKVREVMRAAALDHPGTLKEPDAEVRLIATSASSLDFQLLVWIPDPHERGRIESDLRLEIVNRFRAEGISIPFPQREVRVTGSGVVVGRSATSGPELTPGSGEDRDHGRTVLRAGGDVVTLALDTGALRHECRRRVVRRGGSHGCETRRDHARPGGDTRRHTARGSGTERC